MKIHHELTEHDAVAWVRAGITPRLIESSYCQHQVNRLKHDSCITSNELHQLVTRWGIKGYRSAGEQL